MVVCEEVKERQRDYCYVQKRGAKFKCTQETTHVPWLTPVHIATCDATIMTV